MIDPLHKKVDPLHKKVDLCHDWPEVRSVLTPESTWGDAARLILYAIAIVVVFVVVTQVTT